MIRRAEKIAVILLLGFLPVRPVRAQAPLPLEDLYEAGRHLFESYAPEEIREQIEFPPVERWNEFWRELTTLLDTGSLEDLAWMKPAVESAVEWLRKFPAGAPYADWLEQRLDYFDMAEALVRQIPAPRPPGPPPEVPPMRQGELRPPPQARPPPPPPAIGRRRVESARSKVKWEEKLAGRPIPARASALAPRLKSIFQAEGLPPELVWLAEVESSFNPEARSPVGAAGLFQLMPPTAQRFGLSVQPQDERLVPEKSASAAAKYLRYLHGLYASWPLALAAYNAGEGRVGRALKTVGARTFEGIEDHLPVETQMYVPKVLATIKLRENVEPSGLLPPRR